MGQWEIGEEKTSLGSLETFLILILGEVERVPKLSLIVQQEAIGIVDLLEELRGGISA